MTTLYCNTNPQPCAVQVVSARVPEGQWPATPRAVLYCGSAPGIFTGSEPRCLVQWAVRVSDPVSLRSIVRLYTVDKWNLTEIGGVCRALFNAIPEHVALKSMLGRSCLLSVATNMQGQNRVVGHDLLPPSVAPVILPREMCIAENMWEVNAERLLQAGLPQKCLNWQSSIYKMRGNQ